MLLTILMTLIILTILCKPADHRARNSGNKMRNRESTKTQEQPRIAGSEFPQAAMMPTPITAERTAEPKTMPMKSSKASPANKPGGVNPTRRSKERVEPTQKSDSAASPSSNEEADGTSQDAPSIPIREDGRSYETEMDTAKSPKSELSQRKK